MYSPLRPPMKNFSRYLLASLIFHLAILMWLGSILPFSPAGETRLSLEIVPPPAPLQAVKLQRAEKPRPVKPEPAAPLVNPPLTEKKKPIPREKEFPAKIEVDEQARFSMFKENLAGKKEKPRAKASSAEKMRAKPALPKKPAPKAAQAAKSKPPQPVQLKKEFAVRTEELFVKSRPLPEDASSSRQPPAAGQLLSKLDLEKYGDAGYAGEGMLSFEDADFKAVWYGRIVKKKVVDGWFPPYAARVLGLTGRSIVTFRIRRDGEIIDVKLRDSSGNDSLDQAAFNAVKSVDSLPALPTDYAYDTIGVIFSFWYNLRPPQG